jgi:hypothetical protein
MFFHPVVCKCGVPDHIFTHSGNEFTSLFWNRFCSHLRINHRLSTPFHAQGVAQTERQNEAMKQYLRAFCNYEQDNWVELLPLPVFAYNNSMHHSTCMTLFGANNHNQTSMQLKPPNFT